MAERNRDSFRMPRCESGVRAVSKSAGEAGTVPASEVEKTKKHVLTNREMEVLRVLSGNLTNREIAEKLNISPYTVKRHIENILDKTGCKNRIDLMMNTKSIGLLEKTED